MATIDRITIADEPGTWAALGFAVDGRECQLGGVVLDLAGREVGSGIASWTLRGIAACDLDGLETEASAAAPRAPALPHPNGAIAIDHVVAVAPAFERTVAALQAAGLDLRRIREEPTPAGAPRQAFFRLGREILEVVAEPQEVAAGRGGAERPAFFWGLALLVDDLDETVRAMAPHAGEPRPAVQPGRRISTLRRSAGLAVPLALITREEDARA